MLAISMASAALKVVTEQHGHEDLFLEMARIVAAEQVGWSSSLVASRAGPIAHEDLARLLLAHVR